MSDCSKPMWALGVFLLALIAVNSTLLAFQVATLTQVVSISKTSPSLSSDSTTTDSCSAAGSHLDSEYTQSGRWGNDGDGAGNELYYKGQVQRKMFMESGLLRFDRPSHEFLIVSDLDQKSRDPDKFRWKSYLRRGILERVMSQETDGDDGVNAKRPKFTLRWMETRNLFTSTARNNRSMELSELVRFNHRLLAMCDYTGLIFKIAGAEKYDEDPKVYQRWAIADGDGEKVKPCKIEWATVKDGVLWVGSIGKEWTDSDGKVIHRDPEWIKTIDDAGRVQNLDWGPVYQAIRTATNTSEPGYLWHEAVHWDPRTRRWIFLPRKASSAGYDPVADELMGTNLLIIANEDFSSIEVRRVGLLQKDRGFTAVRKVPGLTDTYMALKVLEQGDVAKTWICVFDLDGHMYLDPPLQLVSEHIKFEGLEFV